MQYIQKIGCNAELEWKMKCPILDIVFVFHAVNPLRIIQHLSRGPTVCLWVSQRNEGVVRRALQGRSINSRIICSQSLLWKQIAPYGFGDRKFQEWANTPWCWLNYVYVYVPYYTYIPMPIPIQSSRVDGSFKNPSTTMYFCWFRTPKVPQPPSRMVPLDPS